MNTTLTPEQKWEQAGLENNFIFYKVMTENPDICKELLELLLEFKIEKLEFYTEHTNQVDYDSKGIRMDVYAVGETTAFNLELQVLDTKELPERSRYYQSVIDVDTLKSGEPYKDLKNSFIIFICFEDIFKSGYPVYIFENTCRQDREILLNDGTYKYFFIVPNCDKLESVEQKNFFYFLTQRCVESNFTNRLLHSVKEAKLNIETRKQFMEFERQRRYDFEAGRSDGYNQGYGIGKEEGYASGKQDGYASGKQDGYASGKQDGYASGKQDGYASGKQDGYTSGKQELIQNMLNNGMTMDNISKVTGLSIKEIHNITAR
ncbi:MAG: Rpn family recombination-promoting nuclease/putative transposase [Treponema sp.]|nr:Rpn family recombination-promoting nuclease/putative transposase [Treponema sp.]